MLKPGEPGRIGKLASDARWRGLRFRKSGRGLCEGESSSFDSEERVRDSGVGKVPFRASCTGLYVATDAARMWPGEPDRGGP